MAENPNIDGVDHVNKPFFTPTRTNKSIRIPSIAETIVLTSGANKVVFADPLEIAIQTPNDDTIIVAQNSTTGIDYVPVLSGTYKILYKGNIQITSPTGNARESSFKIAFYITAVPNHEPLPRWNIRTMIERILNHHQTRLMDEPVQFFLDPAQAEEFEKIEAPEIVITGKNLREALDIVGGYIHAQFRLIKGKSGLYDTVHFDKLGGTEKAKLSDPRYNYACITQIYNQGVEDYVTELDSTVDNLVNSIDPAEGSVTEPYDGGYTSTRSEELYARIEEGNMVIATTKPIYSVQRLEVTVDGHRGNITPYVFEAAEYGRLSSFEGVYPESKAFAIYYTLGQKNVKGLNFKSPSVIGGAGSNYAITNIIKAVTGYDISADWWADITKDGKTISGKYPTLKFRITYTPIFSTRLTMHKIYHEIGAPQSTLFYNQSDNLVETRYYGENLKGVVARMGNHERVLTYLLGTFRLMPRPGQMWDDDYYVAGVTNALYFDHVECTVSLSKDFNRLSQYIGINSMWRAYEVSERNAYNRHIVYSDYAVIGNIEGDGKTLITAAGKVSIRDIFIGFNDNESIPLSAAEVHSYDDTGNNFATCTLPITSTAFGNVMSFQFGMADNYSAGLKSVYAEGGGVSGYWQTDVRYTDYYGRVDTLTFALGTEGSYDENSPYLVPQGAYAQNINIEVPANNRLSVDKNGGEILGFNYEIQFVTTFKDIVIGSALARRCPLVGTANKENAALYVLPNRIGKFDNFVDLQGATRISAWSADTISITDDRIQFRNATPTVDGAAWAIVVPSTGELLFGRNTAVTANSEIEIPPITFTHKLP